MHTNEHNFLFVRYANTKGGTYGGAARVEHRYAATTRRSLVPRPQKAEAPNQTLQTRLCLKYQTVAAVSQTTRKGQHGPVGPGGGGWRWGRSIGRGNLSHLGSFSPGNNKRGEASPKHGRQLMRWEEEEEETSVPGAGRG